MTKYVKLYGETFMSGFQEACRESGYSLRGKSTIRDYCIAKGVEFDKGLNSRVYVFKQLNSSKDGTGVRVVAPNAASTQHCVAKMDVKDLNPIALDILQFYEHMKESYSKIENIQKKIEVLQNGIGMSNKQIEGLNESIRQEKERLQVHTQKINNFIASSASEGTQPKSASAMVLANSSSSSSSDSSDSESDQDQPPPQSNANPKEALYLGTPVIATSAMEL